MPTLIARSVLRAESPLTINGHCGAQGCMLPWTASSRRCPRPVWLQWARASRFYCKLAAPACPLASSWRLRAALRSCWSVYAERCFYGTSLPSDHLRMVDRVRLGPQPAMACMAANAADLSCCVAESAGQACQPERPRDGPGAWLCGSLVVVLGSIVLCQCQRPAAVVVLAPVIPHGGMTGDGKAGAGGCRRQTTKLNAA